MNNLRDGYANGGFGVMWLKPLVDVHIELEYAQAELQAAAREHIEGRDIVRTITGWL